MSDFSPRLSDSFLLDQLENALLKYGQADAVGAGKQKAVAKGTINRLARELIKRGVILPHVREI